MHNVIKNFKELKNMVNNTIFDVIFDYEGTLNTCIKCKYFYYQNYM